MLIVGVLAGMAGLGLSRLGMKLGGTRVYCRLVQEPLGAIGIVLLCCLALCLFLVSARVLFAFTRLPLASTRDAAVFAPGLAPAIARCLWLWHRARLYR